MKYEIFDWRSDKKAKGKLTYQRVETIEAKKLVKLDLRWFNYENYGKKFLCYNPGFNRMYVHTYTHNIRRNWIEPNLKWGNLFAKKEKLKKRIKHENQTSLF